MLESINISGQRAAKIVDNMLSFSRKSESKFSMQNITELLDNTIELSFNDYDLKRKFDFRLIKILREYDEYTPLVFCEKSEIQQVFLNILKNGAQAMADDLKVKKKEKEPCFILQVKPEGNMVCIDIKDTGPGMDMETRKRIFEPFFTTKNVGIGTGLGLSVSYFIITENHKGTMEVESFEGGGTKFIIKLPVNTNV